MSDRRMTSNLSFDEINALVGDERSMPFSKYFGEMKLSRKQKEDRIDLATALEDEFLFIMAWMANTYPAVDPTVVTEIQNRYMGALADVGLADRADLANSPYYPHAAEFALGLLLATARHKDDPYYYSADRAKFMAENESNNIHNQKDFGDAQAEGKLWKRWNTIMDGKERESHAEVDGETVPIDEPFYVGGSELMYPRDDSLGAGAEELINCRCSLEYLESADE